MMLSYIPNALSLARIALTPVLLWCAWQGKTECFLGLLVVSLLTDALDGWIARKFNLCTPLGARLDSLGDMCTYLAVPLCAWWLWPDLIRAEWPYVLLTVSAYVVPLVVALIKFRTLPSYHSYAAKIAAVVMSIAVFMWFVFEVSGLFKFAAILQAVVAVEHVLITLSLSQPRSNIKSIWHVR